jgi:hypothetical protein
VVTLPTPILLSGHDGANVVVNLSDKLLELRDLTGSSSETISIELMGSVVTPDQVGAGVPSDTLAVGFHFDHDPLDLGVTVGIAAVSSAAGDGLLQQTVNFTDGDFTFGGFTLRVFQNGAGATQITGFKVILGADSVVTQPLPPPPKAVLPGFASGTLPGNDDGSTGSVPLGFTANFFGTSYSSLFINNNGNVTFDSALSAFTPFDLSSTGHVIIAPFFADVDTRIGHVVTYGTGIVAGHRAFGVTWPGVGHYSVSTSKLNAFQVVLIDRSDTGPGNFDIEFNYDQIQWETGDSSGGNNGLGGSSARAGFSNGTGLPGTFFELPGSAVNGAFLDSNAQTGLIHNSANSQTPGQYVFSIRAGAPLTHATAAFLQANLDGTTSVQPASVLLGQEPSLSNEIERIVQFRTQAGLTTSPTQLTAELVNGLVNDAVITPQAADPLLASVVQSLPFPAVADIRVHWGSRSMSLLTLQRDLPFLNITAIDVIFNQNVAVTSADLSLASTSTPGQSYTFSGFNYDSASHTATWTLPTALGVDRLMLALDGDTEDGHIGVHNSANTFVGDFSLGFAVLPGDFTGDGVVTAQDAVGVRNQMPPYLSLGAIPSVFADLDGSGIVDVSDYNQVRRRIGQRLP